MANQSVFSISDLKNKAYQGPNYITTLFCYNIVTELQRAIIAHVGRRLKKAICMFMYQWSGVHPHF